MFGYRGLIFDVHPHFQLSQAWYDQVARSRPPKDRPWYRVLCHGADHETYVAEQNLEPDIEPGRPIDHPLVSVIFEEVRDGRYIRPAH